MGNHVENTSRAARRWMLFAFMAGMAFTAALAQTLTGAGSQAEGIKYQPDSAGEHELKPANLPGDNYLDNNLYGLVGVCPGRTAV